MKQKVRRALAVSGIAIAVGASGFGFDAFAQTSKTSRFIKNETRIQRSFQKSTSESEHSRRGKKTIVGIAQSDATETTLTIQKGDHTYTVDITNAKTINRNRTDIAKTDIKIGDKIKIRGTLLGTDFTATSVKDISLPRS